MKSIIETCKPRKDILRGTFNPEIFTASLSEVIRHYTGQGATIHSLYTDGVQFFKEATYPTDGLKMVLSEVFARLAGDATVEREAFSSTDVSVRQHTCCRLGSAVCR